MSKNDITQTGIEHFGEILFTTNITELDLSLNPLGNNGIRSVADSLFEKVFDKRRNAIIRGEKCKVINLNLAETKCQDQGSYYLFKSLMDYHRLDSLTLDHNLIESKKMTTLAYLIK